MQQLWDAIQILYWRLQISTVLEHNVLIGSILQRFSLTAKFRFSLQEKAYSNGTLTLFEAMYSASNGAFECSDHRDYVYGMLGMANDEVAKSVVVNYATLTAKSVFVQVTRQFLRVHGLAVLRYCYFRAEKRDVELPSWVSQWNGPKAPILFGSHIRPQRQASSGLKQAAEPVDLRENDSITLSGVAIDTKS